MENKNKKTLIIILSGILLFVAAFIFIFKFDFKNKNVLSLEENKWIDENKYNMVDIAILNDIPILSDEGEGIIYDYLDYVTENHSLNFNVVTYKLDFNVEYDYQMDIVDMVSKNDIEVFKDNLVLLTVNDIQYTDVSEVNNLRIGVLSLDKENIESYIGNNITYVEYDSYSDLRNSIVNSKMAIENGESSYDVDAIILSRIVATKEIIENELNVAYHFNDLNKYFVIKANGNKELNSILKKSFNSGF